MKLLHLLVAVALSHTAFAQDVCKDVKKESNGPSFRTFESPYDQDNQPVLRVKRTITVDDDEVYDNFVMIFRVVCPVSDIYESSDGGSESQKAEKSLTIVFADNSKIVDDTVEVNHDITPDKTQAIRYIYYPIVADNADDLTSKKIAKFIIAGQEAVLPDEAAVAVMRYAKCIQSEK